MTSAMFLTTSNGLRGADAAVEIIVLATCEGASTSWVNNLRLFAGGFGWDSSSDSESGILTTSAVFAIALGCRGLKGLNILNVHVQCRVGSRV